MSTLHLPILLEPIVQALLEPFLKLPQDSPPHWIVDCTLGGGGHCEAFLHAFNKNPGLRKHRVLALDQDAAAVEKAKTRFIDPIREGRLEVQVQRFGEAAQFLKERPVLGVLADLGFSSDQLEDPARGLSFQLNGPLDMRLDPRRGMSCRDFLNQVTEPTLEKILSELGEERFSRRIAASIIAKRRAGQLPRSTQDLVETVVRAIPAFARHGRIHAATRTFQALRIAVNEEINELESLLENGIVEVKSGGRIAIISFHSLEDRKVKYRFREEHLFRALTKKPIQAGHEEVSRNPRSRSAKLRIAERL